MDSWREEAISKTVITVPKLDGTPISQIIVFQFARLNETGVSPTGFEPLLPLWKGVSGYGEPSERAGRNEASVGLSL
jgi:hypothetical protein